MPWRYGAFTAWAEPGARWRRACSWALATRHCPTAWDGASRCLSNWWASSAPPFGPFIATSAILLAIKYTIGLRVESTSEELGLDLSQHGEGAYTS